MSSTRHFRSLIAENRAFVAPAVFNPLTAKLAQDAGFEMLPPFMFSLPGHGAEVAGLKLAELAALGFRIFASSISALAFHRALKQSYAYLARGEPDPLFAGTTHKEETDALHASIGIAKLLEIERATVER